MPTGNTDKTLVEDLNTVGEKAAMYLLVLERT